MEIHYYMVLLVLHEPALYGSHKVDDFRPPYALRNTTYEQPQTSSESTHVREQCIFSSQGLLESFLAYTDETLRRIPVILYVRMMHAVVVIIKLESSVDAASHQGLVSMNIIDRIIRKLDSASHMKSFHLPRLFHSVLLQLSNWHRNQALDPGLRENGTIEPLLAINEERREEQKEGSNTDGVMQYQVGTNNGPLNYYPQDPVQSSIAVPEWDKLPDDCLISEGLPDETAMAFLDQIFGNGPINFMPPNSWS
jgi:hypothetical protein